MNEQQSSFIGKLLVILLYIFNSSAFGLVTYWIVTTAMSPLCLIIMQIMFFFLIYSYVRFTYAAFDYLLNGFEGGKND